MRRAELAADCSACRGLCCIAKTFDAGPSFAISKPAHAPCPHLDEARRCAIHADLPGRGFAGCAAYDCYGAGPLATRLLERASPSEVLTAFSVLCDVQEARWLLERARAMLDVHSDLANEIASWLTELERIATRGPADLRRVDPESLVARTRALLRRVGTVVGDRATARRRLQVVD